MPNPNVELVELRDKGIILVGGKSVDAAGIFTVRAYMETFANFFQQNQVLDARKWKRKKP